MTDLFDKIRTAIEDVRATGYEPRTVILHKKDRAYIARALGVKVSELTSDMILSVLGYDA